jgi:murein DD-endopeptidase MepM/ murein hydrolase activator NlpD
MRLRRYVLCFVFLSFTGFAACEPHGGSRAIAKHSAYMRQLADSGLEATLLGQRWRRAAERALHEPTQVLLPYAEQGALLAHEAAALGFVFEATAGQVLEIQLVRRSVDDGAENHGRLYVDVFRIEYDDTGNAFTRLEDASIDGTGLKIAIPVSADYVVRIQPELLTSTLYALTLELGASLPFPVAGHDVSAVQSFFGDDRDAGARSHQGIDIFAERLTPVLAVAGGRAVPSRNNLGGNVVWLNTAGISYYYAHLQRFAVSEPRRVAPGDVLGYVGNTGNAAGTSPHLHFALYRWGRGAIDPLPRLIERRLPPDEEAIASFEPRYVRTSADALNLRAAPSLGGDVLARLPNGTIVWAPARSGEWLRVRDPLARGWISEAFQSSLVAAGSEPEIAQKLTLLKDAPGLEALVIAALDPGSEYYPLATLGGHHAVVETGRGLVSGWVDVNESR